MNAANSRMEIAFNADYCVKWLKSQGLIVLCVEGTADLPRINLQRSPLCEKFDGVIYGYQRGLRGELRYGSVYRFGCEVRWDEACREAA